MAMRTFVVLCPANFVRCLTAVSALSSLSLITACGAEPEPAKATEGKGIASVTDPDKQSQAPATVERPLIRPDTSKEEEWRLIQVHLDCVAQQGIKMVKNKDDGSWKGPADTEEKVHAAYKVCVSKEPESLPARTARKDPGWKDKYRQWIKCMRSHGLNVEPTWDTPGTFSWPDGLPPGSTEKWIKKCEAQAYVVE